MIGFHGDVPYERSLPSGDPAAALDQWILSDPQPLCPIRKPDYLRSGDRHLRRRDYPH